MTTLEYPADYEPAEVADAKNIVQDELDGAFYGDNFFEHTEDGPIPDFIGLADNIVEALLKAGVHVPTDLIKERF